MSIRVTKILKLSLTLLIPILIITTAVRVLATDQYLAFEYRKASFPPDPFGFTGQQRFELASSNIHYVRAHLPDEALSGQTLNGSPVYNPREVTHMTDVQAVFQAVLRVWQVPFVLLLFLGFILWQNRQGMALASAIQSGGFLTSGIILMIAMLAVFAWQTWFDLLHRFFFVRGSWLFSYSDTLIRLFPIKFWFDATLTASILSLAGGLWLAFIGWQGQRLLAKKQV